MRIRVETIGDGQPEEVVVYCRAMTPEVEATVRLIQEKDKVKSALSFFKGEEQFYLSLREILFFETDSERVFAHTVDDAFEVKSRLYEIEAALPGNFVRISRSTIVNTLHVYSIQRGLTRVSHIAFRHSHKEVYGSRLYNTLLNRKMEERVLYENE